MYHFRDKAKYWSKSRFFHTPPAFDVPVRVPVGTMPVFGMEKPRMAGIPYGEKRLRIRLLVSIQYTNVTDGRTNVTDGHRMTA